MDELICSECFQNTKIIDYAPAPAPPPIFLADQLTLSQPGGQDYSHCISTGTPGFLDLPTALD